MTARAPAASTPSAPPVPPSVLRMAGPLVVSFWMRAAFTFVDTIYASTLGDAAVAAIGLTIPFEFLMIAVWVGLSTGLTSALSRSMGAHAGERIEQYLRISWRLVTAASLLFLLLGGGIWLFAPHVDLEPEVRRSFQVYGTVLIVGSAFTTFWSVIPDSLVKAHHDTRSTMWAGIWSNVINLALNTVFVFAFHWGIFGIALSTVVGRIGGLVYALVRADQHESRRKRAGMDRVPGLDPAPYRTLLSLAVPSALSFGLVAAESALANVLLAGRAFATESIAAYSIVYRVMLFALNPVIATGVAMLPYAARRFGEGDLAAVRRGLRESTLAGVGYSLFMVGPSVWLAAPWLADWLAESPVTRELTAGALRSVPFMCLAAAPFLLCRPVFEGMQRGTPGLVIAAVRYLVLTAPLAWIGMSAAAAMGKPPLYGMLAGLIAAAAFSSAVFYAWLRAALPKAVAPQQVHAHVLGGEASPPRPELEARGAAGDPR